MRKHRSLTLGQAIASGCRGHYGRRLSQRWLRFVQAVMDRYGRVPGPQQSVLLVLLKRLAPLDTNTARWLQSTSVFSPVIKLNISSISRPAPASPKPTADRRLPTSNFATRTITATARPTIEHRQLRAFATAFPGSPNVYAPIVSAMRRVTAAMAITQEPAKPNHGVNLQTHISHLRCETRPVERSPEIAKRVLDKRRRVEDHASGVTRELLQSPSRTKATPVVHPFEEFEARVAQHNRVTPQSPVDIERLTDHVVRCIDERMLAHRERMGRVF